MYDFNFFLKHKGHSEYEILSEKGHLMHVIRKCDSQGEALVAAKAWASSWHSSNVEMYDECKIKQGD